MNGPEPENLNDDIDRAIRDALSVEVDPRRVARLERYWSEESRSERRRRRVWQVVPAVAAVAAMILVAVFVWVRRSGEDSPAIVVEHRPMPVERNKLEKPRPSVAQRADGREPTTYERFMFLTKSDMKSPATAKKPKIDEVVAEAQAFPGADARELLENWSIESGVAEKMLLRKLPQTQGEEQAAVLRLLGGCGSQESIPVILRAARRGANREEVLAALERIAGVEGLPRIAIQTTDERLQRAIIGRLLSDGSDSALRDYLSLVREASTRDTALHLATTDRNLNVDRLMALLDDDDKPTAMSAARVLGHVNGPVITAQLIARVTERPSDSDEAWAALMACRGELAQQFLDYAASRPQLLGHLNGARMQTAQMIP